MVISHERDRQPDYPVTDTRNPGLHLVLKIRNPSRLTQLYIPFSAAPGRSTDLLRIDCLPRAALSVDSVVQQWLTGYAQFAGTAGITVELVKATRDERLLHAGFRNPIVGYHHTVFRYVRTDDQDYGIQFIRKLYPLTPAETAHRMTYVKRGTLPLEESSDSYSDFARLARDRSDALHHMMQSVAATKQIAVGLDELGAMLDGACAGYLPYPSAK